MKKIVREFFRRISRLPGVDVVAVRIEDWTDLARIGGTSGRRRAVRDRMAACRTAGDWLALGRPLLPPTQIDSEILGLLALAGERPTRRVLEIGTAQGGTTFLLARAIPTTTWIASVDLLPRHSRVLRFLCGPERRFSALRGSSATEPMRRRIFTLVGEERVDLLFLDGDHSYEGVRSDFLQYSPLVRPGGLIVFHDIVPAEETGAPTAGHRWVGGVPRFWQEIKPTAVRSWEFVESWKQQGFGIGVIEVGAASS